MSTPTREQTRTGPPAREGLCRTVPFRMTRSDDGDDDGQTIEGYGAVFNSVTFIDSWEGSFEEEILPGAFRKSLRERTPKMQFDHGQHPLLGSLPLGRWDSAEEDTHGLLVKGRLSDNWLVQPFRDAIRDEAVSGMSFRFSVVRDQWFDRDGNKIKEDELSRLLWEPGDRGPIRRKLAELKCSEVGPVTWPAYEDTEVGVRSLDGRRTVVIDLARLMAGHSGEQARLAKLVAVADRATGDAPPSGIGDNQTPDDYVCEVCGERGHQYCTDTPGERTEPQATEAPADEHPPNANGAPPVTETSAGEHSSANGPTNPVERARDIKARFRQVTDRVLALPNPSSEQKERAQ